MKKKALAIVAVVALLAGLHFTFRSVDLVGLIVKLHGH